MAVPAADEDPVAPTERRNPRTYDIDRLPTADLLQLINAEDALVPAAIARVLPALAELVDRCVERVASGGRVHYVGAGTSGRIAVLDAAELLPTFGLDERVVVAHLAGGDRALRHAVEGVEDDDAQAAADLAEVGPRDVVLGLAASGRTPYVAGALRHGRSVGAVTALVSANPDAPLAAFADLHVCVETGSEVVTGSTRMKAGSAQKMVLNGLSTALAIRLGRTWSNLMIDLAATNEKLRARSVRMLEQATGASAAQSRAVLDAAGGEVKTALLCLLLDCKPDEARSRLAAAGGHARRAAGASDAGPDSPA